MSQPPPAKVLVTGASGYIASSLIPLLRQNYFAVHGLDRLPADKSIASQCESFSIVDITDVRQLAPVMETSWDVVFHLAALVEVAESIEKPQLYLQTNWHSTETLVDKLDYRRFVFVSSAAANEPSSSPYALSKIKAEESVRKINPCACSIARLYNVVGGTTIKHANSSSSLFAGLVRAQHSGQFIINGDDYDDSPDGTCVRSLIHVHDVANSLIELLQYPPNGRDDQPMELAYEKPFTVKQFAEAFKRVNACNFAIKVCQRRPGDIPCSRINTPAPCLTKQYAELDKLVRHKF